MSRAFFCTFPGFYLLLLSHIPFHIPTTAQQKNNIASLQPVIDSLVKELRKTREDTSKVRLLNEIGWQLSTSAPDSARTYVLEALTLAEQLNYLSGQAVAHSHLGATYQLKGEFEDAIKYYSRSLELRKKLNDKPGMARCYNNLAGAYRLMGNFTLSADNLMLSLRIKEELGDLKGLSAGYNNLGNLSYAQDNIPKAKEYFMESLHISEKLEDKKQIAIACNNLGGICSFEEKFDEALAYYERSLALKKELGDFSAVAKALLNIGMAYEGLEKYDLAFDYLNQSVEMCKQIDDKETLTACYNNLGNTYHQYGIKTGNNSLFYQALAYQLQALTIARSIQYGEGIKISLQKLAAVSADLKDYKKAYEYECQYAAFKDTLLNENNLRQINEMQAKYDTERKNKELIKQEAEIKQNQLRSQNEQMQRYGLYGGLSLTIIFGWVMFNRFRKTRKQKIIIEDQKLLVEKQKDLVEEKQKEILDSIYYARRIQRSLLPNEKYLSRHIK